MNTPNPFKWLAERTIRNYQNQSRDIKRLELEARLKYCDSPNERHAILKQINAINK